MKATKYLICKDAVCSECLPAQEYFQKGKNDMTCDAWARKHAQETGHIVTITEAHDVAVLDPKLRANKFSMINK